MLPDEQEVLLEKAFVVHLRERERASERERKTKLSPFPVLGNKIFSSLQDEWQEQQYNEREDRVREVCIQV